MSVIGRPIGDLTPATVAQPVVNVDMTTGSVAPPLTNSQLRASPVFVQMNRGTLTAIPASLTADTPATIVPLDSNLIGARILNYGASPVYLSFSTSGTPASGAGSDYIPAAASGVPGVWEPPFAPINGVRAVSAATAGLTVITW